MSKGKHRKKQKISISFLVILLLSVSFFSTGIIIGGQLTKTPQSQTYKTEPAQLTSNLTPDEQRLASKIDQLLQKSDYIGSIQKAMTALLILKQIQAGKLTFDTKLAEFYPQIPGGQQITIKNMLYMRSGLHRTASPDKPMSDSEIIQFALHHLKLTDYDTYHYEPLNYTLLTGILIKLTNQPYETLLKKEIIRPLHLEHTDFYDNVKNSPQHAVSYQMSATDDYSKALIEPETDIRNELGTGNISMSVYDLNKFFTSVLSGGIIPKELLFSLWQNNGDKHPYSGGVYSGNDYILAQGNINRFHAVVAMKKDTKDAIVMESNIQSDKNIKLPATDLRNQIYELMEGVNLKS